jgi:hypothetical protein
MPGWPLMPSIPDESPSTRAQGRLRDRPGARCAITVAAIHRAAGEGRSHADDGEVVLVRHPWTDGGVN